MKRCFALDCSKGRNEDFFSEISVQKCISVQGFLTCRHSIDICMILKMLNNNVGPYSSYPCFVVQKAEIR